MNRSRTFLVVAAIEILFLACTFTELRSADNARAGSNAGLAKTTSNDDYRAFTINNIFNYYSNNGDGSFNKYTFTGAFEYPRGSGKTAVFEEGVVWGGYHKGVAEPKVGGSVYRHGLQAGRILYPGSLGTDPTADDPWRPENRVYRVRPDISPSTPFTAVEGNINATETPFTSRYEPFSAQDIYNQYIQDWNEWPAASGAPYTDVNADGIYDPSIDVPGQPGADQTLFYVANDCNPSGPLFLSGSPVIGLEMHRTIWGYNKQGVIGGTVFATTLLINKSGAPVDSMYTVQWADPDLGDAGDDFVGCDTALSLGYVYNSQAFDGTYGTAVPAVGYSLLQGPIVPGQPADSALFKKSYRHGFKNLGLSAFVMFTQGVPGLADPRQGTGGNLDWYNLMKGRIASSGQPFIDPTNNQPTKFVMAGDPVAGTGWIDGPPFAPAQDRRMCLVTGPFTLANNDTQEIVVATTAALGTNYLNSVSVLKGGTVRLKDFLTGGIIVSIAAVDTLYPAHVPITLRGSGTTLIGGTPALAWSLASKPANSLAAISVLDSGRAQITPDTPGVYRVRLVGSAGGTITDTAYVDINVTSVQRPIAAFSVASSVTLGDTVTIDGSASYDPNGLPLTRSWTVTGSRAVDIITPRDSLSGYLSSTSEAKVKFVPLRTNLHRVQLMVSNGAFVTSLVKTFQVRPLASSNVSVERQLTSGKLHQLYPNLPNSGYYFWSPIKEFDGRIWVGDGGLCAAMNFNDVLQPDQVYALDGFSFDGAQNIIAGSWSSYATVIRTNGHGGVESSDWIPLPFPRPTADTGFSAPIVKPPYLLLPCGAAGILIYNISVPGYPSLLTQISNGERWGKTFVDGTLLYAIHPGTQHISVLDIASLPAITPIASIGLDQPYSSLTKVGQYFYLIKSSTSLDPLTANADAITIYDFSNLSVPVVKGSITVPKTLNAFNRFNAVSGYNNTIITSTAEGVYLYDVTNPASPVLAGSLLTGSCFGTVYMNASHMLAVNLNRERDPEFALEGLLELRTPFTSVERQEVQETPSAFCLDQNYPNPFNPSTGIRFQVPGVTDVKLVVYDLLGREVAVLANERKVPGSYEVQFDGSGMASGVYMYRLTAGSFVQTRKMLLVK